MSTKKTTSAGGNSPRLRDHLEPDEQTQLANLPTGFGVKGLVLPKKADIKSFSPILKPADFPAEPAYLLGVFKKIFNTREFGQEGTKKQGLGVEIVPHGARIGVALPVVATLRIGLEIDGQSHSPYIGRTVCIQKYPERIKSNKGNDAWNFVVAIYPEGWQQGDE
jgi:hypothetical protein